ncbi:hypothetical protein ACJRO7_021813 [Eucalyptus globulus]|uniref:Uncharacterized protein n=1 Tax=Eucalyptus globulus TaxID=34317 RepID=A0ABD3KQL5_EUCGL
MNRTYTEERENEIGQAPTTGRILAGRSESVAAMVSFLSVVRSKVSLAPDFHFIFLPISQDLDSVLP